MKALINGIKSIIGFFSTIWNTITSIFNMLINFFKYLKAVVSICTNFIATLPSWILTFATISLAIIVLFQILNRKAGESD